MEIILRDDIKGLGYKDDIINVKPGYGRNYLIPQGLAIIANKSNKKMISENIKQASHKAEKIKQDAESLSNKIGDLVLEIKAKAGEKGKIFGAVTTLQVSDALKELGYKVDRKRIAFSENIKFLGEYTATLDLHKEVKREIKFNVVEA